MAPVMILIPACIPTVLYPDNLSPLWVTAPSVLAHRGGWGMIAAMRAKPDTRQPDFTREDALEAHGLKAVAGVDEVGRGCLAGPVVAAAVVLDRSDPIDGLRDSKMLTPRTRAILNLEIRKRAQAWAIGTASVEEIEDLNILGASLLAMRRAVASLQPAPDSLLVDGNRDPGADLPTELVVKGDQVSRSIAAASIIAKVFRDRLMAELGEAWPDYGWAQNAGYGSRAHMDALQLVGPSPHHRKSFAPIAKLLDEGRSVKS